MIAELLRRRKLNNYPTVVDTLVYILIIALCFAIANFLRLSISDISTATIFISYIVCLAISTFFILLYRKVRTGNIYDILSAHFFRFKWYAPSKLLLSIVVMFAIQILLLPIVSKLQPSFESLNSLANSFGGFLIAVIIVVAPIFEEVLFRGIFLNDIGKKYGTLSSVIISALIFGAIHLSLPQFITMSVQGLLFGTLYISTKSLISVIVLHSINNAMAITIIKLFPQGMSQFLNSQEFISTTSLHTIYIISAIIVAMFLAYLVIISSKIDKQNKINSKKNSSENTNSDNVAL